MKPKFLSNNSTSEQVKRCIATCLDITTAEIRDDDTLQYNLGVDSLDKAAIIQEVEAHFGRNISNADAAKLLTVQDIVSYIDKPSQRNEDDDDFLMQGLSSSLRL